MAHTLFLCVAVLLFPRNAQIDCTHQEGDLRLMNGETANEGRVEIYHNGLWGTVCDDSWGLSDAQVVCRQLNYSGALEAPTQAFFGEGSYEQPILLDDVACTGLEMSLYECASSPWGYHDCTHAEDAGVICQSSGHVEDGAVRLVGSSSDSEGRVEIYHDSVWGTVCDDDWDMDDAAVVCRQLGYVRALQAVGQAHFGTGHGFQPIYLDDVQCTGSEAQLADCLSQGWGVHDCSHFEDAGVICSKVEDGQEGQVRLSSGSSSNEGRVEIYHDGRWGTVCDDGWDLDDATVACRQLGYERATEAPTHAHFGAGGEDTPIFMDEVHCDGRESMLSSCDFDGWEKTDCSHWEDAGAVCASESAGIPSWIIGLIICLSLIIFGLFASVVMSFRSSKRRRGAATVFSVSGNPSAAITPSSAQGGGESYPGSFGYVPLETPPSYETVVATARPFWVPNSYLNSESSSAPGNSNEVANDS